MNHRRFQVFTRPPEKQHHGHNDEWEEKESIFLSG